MELKIINQTLLEIRSKQLRGSVRACIITAGYTYHCEDLHCDFDCARESHYTGDDLQSLLLIRLGTWICSSVYESERSFAYALMLKANIDGTFSRIGIARF
jgi:hypothetical protein